MVAATATEAVVEKCVAMATTAGVGNGGSIAPRAQVDMFGGHAASAPTARGFEPLRAEPNGFLVHHLSHSVTLSVNKFPDGKL